MDQNKLLETVKELGIPDHLTCILRNLYSGQEATVITGCGKTDWFQIRKGIHQGHILLPAYLTSMQRTSCEMLDWMKLNMESSLPGAISTPSGMQMISPLLQKVKRN